MMANSQNIVQVLFAFREEATELIRSLSENISIINPVVIFCCFGVLTYNRAKELASVVESRIIPRKVTPDNGCHMLGDRFIS